MSAQPAPREERLLVVGDVERLGPIARRCFSPFRIDAVRNYLAAIAEAPRAPTAAILIGIDPHCRRLESAIAALRQVAGASRLVLCCEPAYESWGRRAVAAGANEYLIFPPGDAELERALGIPGRATREYWTRLRPGDTSVCPHEIELLSEALGELESPPSVLMERAARLVRAAFGAAWATIVVDEIVGRSTADAPIAPPEQAPPPVPGMPPSAAAAAPTAMDEQPSLIQAVGPIESPRGQIMLGPRVGGGFGMEDAQKLRHYSALLLRLVEAAGRLQGWRESAYRDDLTGLGNRRYLMALLTELLAQAHRDRFAVTILLFDIDDFKRYNDHYGHAAGDEILKETGQLFTQCCRKGDVVCRLGGDEFVVVFSDPTPRVPGSQHPPGVVAVLNRFRAALHKHSFTRLGPEAVGHLTISGGLAAFPWQGRTAEELLQKADEALLEAKSGGKNSFWLVGAGDVCK